MCVLFCYFYHVFILIKNVYFFINIMSVTVLRRFSFSFRGSWINGKGTFPMATLVRHTTVMRKAGYRLSIFYAFVNCLGAHFSHHTLSCIPPCFTFSRHLSCLCQADKTRNGQNGCHRPTVLSILIAFIVFFSFLLFDNFLSNKNRYFIIPTKWRYCFVT